MPSEKDNILEFNQYMKSDKNVIFYLCWYWIFNQRNRWMYKNSENSLTAEIGEHIPCGYSISTIWPFENIENKYTLYRGEDCMKKSCTSLKEHATNVINFEKKKVLPLIKEEVKSHQDAKFRYIWKKKIHKGIEKLETIAV